MPPMSCRPTSGAMPQNTPLCRNGVRQYPLPWCYPRVAVRPAEARCLSIWLAVVVMAGSITALMLSMRCRPRRKLYGTTVVVMTGSNHCFDVVHAMPPARRHDATTYDPLS